jgi:dihydroneopterin aldolase
MHSLIHHPTLMDCRRLFLRNYEVWINIGVHEFEKKGEQRVLINVDLYVPLAVSAPRACRPRSPTSTPTASRSAWRCSA